MGTDECSGNLVNENPAGSLSMRAHRLPALTTHPLKSLECSVSRLVFAVLGIIVSIYLAGLGGAFAQQTQGAAPTTTPAQNWPAAVQSPENSTTIPQTPPAPANQAAQNSAVIKLFAQLTNAGTKIDKGLVWRVYEFNAVALNAIVSTSPKLLATHRQPAPSIKLKTGTYAINVAFGQANLTRKITVKPGVNTVEKFILNAGGLRIRALLSDGAKPPDDAIRFDVFSDHRNQFGERTRIISGVKPGVVVRLNAGIYFVNSIYGDANSKVSTDVTVQTGKITELTLNHAAARVTLKLVTRSGGEALADARWQLETSDGVAVLKTVGAIPSQILAAGSYVVTVRYGAQILKRSFSVSAGQDVNVEVIIP